MARTKDQSQAERNRRICLLRRNGFTFSEIADMEGLSRVRVSQIVAEVNSELPEDETRAEIASLLEFAERKAVELINNPGYVCGPTGRVVEGPDGEPLPNKTVMVDALKTVILVAEKRSRLYGTDKQVKRETPPDLALQQMWAAIAGERQRLEDLARQAGVIPGQVVRELPPGT